MLSCVVVVVRVCARACVCVCVGDFVGVACLLRSVCDLLCRAATKFVPDLCDHFVRTAPAGADVTSWRY